MDDRNEIWGIWRSSQLLVMLLNPLLNIFCSVAGLKEDTGEYRCLEGVYLVGSNVYAGGMCQRNIHTGRYSEKALE